MMQRRVHPPRPLHSRTWLLAGAIVAAIALLPAAVALAKSPKVESLERLLKDPSDKVRIKAALGLGKLADKDAVPALSAALKDGVPAVRAAAAKALGQIGDISAKGALTTALKDSDPDVRGLAANAIAILKVPGPTKMLKKSYFVEIGDIHDKSKAKFGPTLVARYKELMSAKLRGHAGDFFWVRTGYPEGLTFAGAIKKVAKVVDGSLTQMDVALSLVVTSNPGKRIVTIVDTEAGVGVEGTVSASEEQSLAREALEAALDEAFKGFMTAMTKSE